MTLNLRKLLEEGAWDDDTKTSSEVRKLKNLTSRDNFKTNPFQYFFNPFVRGPLSHISSEAYDGIISVIYNLMKNKNSDKIQSFKSLKKELEKIIKEKDIKFNPWEKDIQVLLKGIKKINANIENVKSKYFLQWLLNPFVKGELTTTYNNTQLENIEKLVLKYSKTNNLSSKEKFDKIREIDHKQTLDKLPKAMKAMENVGNKDDS